MKIEALKPLTIRRPAGDIQLIPGTPVEFTEAEGRRLLDRAVGKVRAIEDPLQVGMIIEWDSPLFGLLRGVVLEIRSHAVLIHHPLTEREVFIPQSWLRMTTR
jgi:hypothetical protein